MVYAGTAMGEWMKECWLDPWRSKAVSLIGSDNNPTELQASHFWTLFFFISLSISRLRELCSVQLQRTGGTFCNEFNLHVEFSPLVTHDVTQQRNLIMCFFYMLRRETWIRIKRFMIIAYNGTKMFYLPTYNTSLWTKDTTKGELINRILQTARI